MEIKGLEENEFNAEIEIEELISEIEDGIKEMEKKGVNQELSPAPECGEIIFSTMELYIPPIIIE